MIRGIQRQTVVIKTQESPYFEEAQLLLRPTAALGEKKNDILREADRILRDSGLFPSRVRNRRRGKSVAVFFIGLLSGMGGMGLVWALTVLL